MEISRAEPDWLDLKCSAVLDQVRSLPLDDRIKVIEQVLDYLRLDKAQTEDSDQVSR